MRIETNSSTRIYKDKLNMQVRNNILGILYIGNEAKIAAYSLIIYEQKKELAQSIHLTIKKMFDLNTYYTNFAVTEAKWTKSSNVELNKMYISDAKLNIKHRKKIIKKLVGKIKFWDDVHNYIIEISKAIKYNNKLPKLKCLYPYYFYLAGDEVFVEANYKTKTVIYNLYDFEHSLVTAKVKNLTNKLNMIKRGLNYQEQKLNNLNKNIVKSCFGTKKLFKAQRTLYSNQNEWKEDFYKARHKTIELQGVNTVSQGNACVEYDYKKNILSIQLPYENIKGKYHKSLWFDVPGVDFPYHKEVLINALNTPRSSISWRITDKGDYFLFKPSYKLFKDESKVNHSKADGIIGYDINYNHIAWTDTDKTGNLLDFGSLKFDLENKTSGQINKILEKCAIDLVNIAKDKYKPLAGEDIKNISKATLTYGNAKRNRRISMFAHQKIIEAIASRAFKESVAVFYVNPAYTSQIGKIKYMKAKGISIHTSASYCIARKALGYKEKLPSLYKKLANNWVVLSKGLKAIRTHYFYKLPSPIQSINFKEFAKDTLKINCVNLKVKPTIIFSFK